MGNRKRTTRKWNPPVIVTAIEPADYGLRLVHLIDKQTGETFQITYGESVSEKTIRNHAPIIARTFERVRGRDVG